jgi:hypothetical protein
MAWQRPSNGKWNQSERPSKDEIHGAIPRAVHLLQLRAEIGPQHRARHDVLAELRKQHIEILKAVTGFEPTIAVFFDNLKNGGDVALQNLVMKIRLHQTTVLNPIALLRVCHAMPDEKLEGLQVLAFGELLAAADKNIHHIRWVI